MTQSSQRPIPGHAAILVAAVPLLAITAIANTGRLNPDAVGYLEIARHWHVGDVHLAVSAYWGPLWSWIVAVLLWPLPNIIAAGRITMAISALIFIGGGIALLRALAVPRAAASIGALCLLCFALSWSVKIMTPDLLVSGLLMFATAAALHPDWATVPGRQFGAGALFGLAYYGKAIGLPLGLAFILLAGAKCALSRIPASKATARTAAVMLLIAAPWITLLSFKVGYPTFGTSGAINYLNAGPAYLGTHPTFTTFHIPSPGQVTSWEDPSVTQYERWSPLDDAASFRHFLNLLRSNLLAGLATLRGFDALGLGLAGLVIAPFAVRLGEHLPWRAGLAPVAVIVGVYLPVTSAGEPRYMMPAYPFLLAAAGGILFGMADARRRTLAGVLLAALFVLPLRDDIGHAMIGSPNASFLAAGAIARAVHATDMPGGVASVGELGFAALFTAFLLDRPFIGTEDALPDLARLRNLGVGILLVGRDRPEDRALAADPTVASIDAEAPSITAYRLR